MPQIMIALAAGVAAYAGYRWVQKQFVRAEDAARAAEADVRRQAETRASVPKDLGTLEWDESAGAYRPKRMN